ncbi:MAG: porin family protein [Acidobacteria bacterium]|jgi:opacity protein-like surface antigen|nr:porin family protein [Acidobacteriota bacterium]
MKKSFLLLLLLPCLAVAAFGQESRMEASVSGSVLIPPFVAGSGAVYLHATPGWGTLFSYRYDVTPLSQLELNYSYMQDKEHFSGPAFNYMVSTRINEISFAYVRMFNFRNFNPFVEMGAGAYIFTPIDDTYTTLSISNMKQKTNPGALYGVGFAYELSPSWDLRVEYRGIIMKTPGFGYLPFDTQRYYNVNDPVIGFAYHF